MNILIDDPPPNVLGVLTFGSYARGNHTANSDIDVCVISTDLSVQDLEKAKSRSFSYLLSDPNLEITIYDRRTFKFMADSASLFLWHLKLEGNIQFERNRFVSEILTTLPPCPDVLLELDVHQRVFNIIMKRRGDGEVVNVFDMAAAHTILRNVCILLCAHVGQFRFGRKDAFQKVLELHGDLGISRREYELLLRYHLLYQRGTPLTDGADYCFNTETILANASHFIQHARMILEKKRQ